MKKERKHNLLIDGLDGLLTSIIHFTTLSHFLDTSPMVQFIELAEIEELPPKEKKILSKYIREYKKYRKEKQKYLDILKRDDAGELFKNDDKLKLEFIKITKIVKDDSYSSFNKSLTGQKILQSIINSKSIYEILSKLFLKPFSKTKQSFELKMFSFKEMYNEKRLKQLSSNTIIDTEIKSLNEEFYNLGGLQLIELCNIKFEDFLKNISDFDDSISIISGDFKRDIDFFLSNVQIPIENIDPNDFDHIIKENNKSVEKNLNEFVSKHLMKILYVFELQNHIDRVKNFHAGTAIGESSNYTLKRQIIATLLLLKEAGLDQNSIDNKVIAKFIRFITKVGLTQENITNTTIYKTIPKVDLFIPTSDLDYAREQLAELNLPNFKKFKKK